MKHGKIDKSALTFGEPERIRDANYLKSFKDTACWACGRNDGTVVPAHFSLGNYARGLKAGDDQVAGLCNGPGSCHDKADHGTQAERVHVWLKVLQTALNRHYLMAKEFEGNFQQWLYEKQKLSNFGGQKIGRSFVRQSSGGAGDGATPMTDSIQTRLRTRAEAFAKAGGGDVIKGELREAADLLDECHEALIWCSAAEEFMPEGSAREGWKKMVKPLLEKLS